MHDVKMKKLRLSSGFISDNISQVSVLHDIWTPWDSESDLIMGYFISGIQDLSIKFSRISISKWCNYLKDITTYIGVDGEGAFDLMASKQNYDYAQADKKVRWNTLPDDYKDLSMILKIECAIKDEIVQKYRDGSDHEKQSIINEIDREFSLAICNLNMTLAIAKPGSFQISGSRHADNRLHTINNFSKFWYTVPTHINDVGWPNFRNLPTELVWSWLCAQPGALKGRSKTPVSKALCIFSRLFRSHYSSDELQDVVWAISGIECLLGEGGRSIVGSMREKLKLIFPDIDSAKIDIEKTIKKIYQLRSSLVHGSENIMSNFNIIPDSKQETEADIGEIFSTSILLCLLQNAFIRKIDKFEFDYILR